MNTIHFLEIMKVVGIVALLSLLVLHCGGGGVGGSGTDVAGPGPSHYISGTISWPSGWEGVPVFDVRHEGTRAEGGVSSGNQALYPCSNVTCDCAGNCIYQIVEYDGTYEVTVRIASAYGDYISTPLSHTVVVDGADVTGQDFEIE